MKKIKLCVFADYHYWPGNYPATNEGLREIIQDAHEWNADCMVHCGDFVHTGDKSAEFVNQYRLNAWKIPAYGCIGNHETEAVDDFQSVLATYGMENNYEYHDLNGFRLIMLDTNYYVDEAGVYQHNPPRSNGGLRKPQNCISPDEFAWLRHTIQTTNNPCVLFSHASFEKDDGCPQAREVREMLESENRKTPGKVLMCINGHYHRNSIKRINDIVYFDLNAVYMAHWQQTEHGGFPTSFAKSARLIPHVYLFDRPLHACVSIMENGQIDIHGMECGYQYDVTPESQGIDSTNIFERKAEPRVSSFHQEAFLVIKP